jgi:hypothetical protein
MEVWPLYLQGKSPRYALHRRLVGPQNTVSKTKIPKSRRESNPDHPIFQPVASPIPTELSRLMRASRYGGGGNCESIKQAVSAADKGWYSNLRNVLRREGSNNY